MINGQTIIKTEKGKNWPCMNDPKPPSPLKSTNFRVQKKTGRPFSPNSSIREFLREREREPGRWNGRLKREVDIIRGLIHHKSNAALTSPDSAAIIAVPQLFTPFFVPALFVETSAVGS